jgi:hypothetical protein
MPYEGPSYQDSEEGGSSFGGGGSTTTNGDPPVGAPILWLAVLDDLSLFFDTLGGTVTSHGSDQNSYYYNPGDSSPLDPKFLQEFGWMPHAQDMGGYRYFDYLTSDVDLEFLLTAYGANSFAAKFAGGSVAVSGLSDGTTFAFNTNGITLFGIWHPGAPTVARNDDIIVTGGHWTFQYTGFDAGHYNGDPPSPPPQLAPSSDAAAALANPDAVAEAHRQSLSLKLHALLDQSGGHATVTFKGPNGAENFDLADFVNILDHYRVTSTTQNYISTSGGAGMVHPDGHGGWVTEVNRSQLTGYATASGNMLDFFILHEVSHMMANAMSYSHTQFQSWLTSGGTSSSYLGTNGFDASAALWRGESYVNDMAAAVEVKLDIAPPQHPPGGYDYTGTYAG